MNGLILAAIGVLKKAEETIVSAGILIIAGLTIANVFSRTVLGSSLALAEEVSQFCVIAVTFVGLSYAARLSRHVRMTALTEQLSPHLQHRVAFVTQLTTCALMWALSAFAAQYVYSVYRLGGIYPVTRIPFYIVYAVAPLGFLLAGLQYLLNAVRGDFPFLQPDVATTDEIDEGAHG